MRQALCVDPEVWTCSVTKDKISLRYLTEGSEFII